MLLTYPGNPGCWVQTSEKEMLRKELQSAVGADALAGASEEVRRGLCCGSTRTLLLCHAGVAAGRWN